MRRHLCPAAWRGPQIDHFRPTPDQPEPIIQTGGDLGQRQARLSPVFFRTCQTMEGFCASLAGFVSARLGSPRFALLVPAVARALRDCRVTRIFEGANDVLRLHLAGEALTWPLAEIAALPPLAPTLSPVLRDAAAELRSGPRGLDGEPRGAAVRRAEPAGCARGLAGVASSARTTGRHDPDVRRLDPRWHAV